MKKTFLLSFFISLPIVFMLVNYTQTANNILLALVKNQFFIAVTAATIGAVLALVFGKRVQFSILRKQIQKEAYADFSNAHDELMDSLINAQAALRGVEGQCIVLRSINSSRDLPGNSPYEVDARIRKNWTDYVERTANLINEMTGGFSKIHRFVEKSYFIYPRLELAFGLLRDEHTNLVDERFEITSRIWRIDPLELISENGSRNILEQLRIDEFLEHSMEFLVHNIDFLSLLQHELLGDLFEFKPKIRRPEIGRVLTIQGWSNPRSQN